LSAALERETKAIIAERLNTYKSLLRSTFLVPWSCRNVANYQGCGCAGKPRASVIFVHGLGGHAYDTWRRAPDNNAFWPLWLAKDLEGISVYTLAYEAPPSNWLGTSMPLQDRAVNVLELLLSEPGLKSGPIIFICHSLGGLVVKQIVLDLQQQKDRRPEAANLLQRVTQVVFAATPHTGTRRATLLDRLRFFAGHCSKT
jgi:pimeloyl-ACP methyl ester carboxylesterase